MTPPPDQSTSVPLPEGLEALDRLARNLAWTWDAQIASVLAEVDPGGLAAASGNPVGMLAGASPARLAELGADAGFRERLTSAAARLDERLAAPGWYATLPDAPRAIAYFSPEFGLSEALPQYSGGSASSPATTSRRPATWACRSSASASSTATATSASC